MKLAFLGLGLMGRPMALRLHAAGHVVTVWNRSTARAAALAQESPGLRAAASLPTALAGVECIVSMVQDGDALHELTHQPGVAAALTPGTLWIDMSSVRPDQARAHAGFLHERGVASLDAPVSGGTLGAEAGTLAIMAGGELGDFERAAPVFAALGRATWVGPHGAGQIAKLANQMIVGATVAAVAEALLFAQRGGADMAKVRDAIRGGFAESRVLEVHGARIVAGDFTKRAAIDVQWKDMRNALQTAADQATAMPLAALVESLCAQASAHGLGDLDQAALYLELVRRQRA